MKHSLSVEDRKTLDGRIARTEAQTGAQIVLAVIERSDAYPEIPWKAFALGISFSALAVLIVNILFPFAPDQTATLWTIVILLSSGAGPALLCVFVPDFARLFLSRERAETETRQYAENLFLDRDLFTTPTRRAVLVMISLFEHRIVILPDKGLAKELSDPAAKDIIAAMRPHLKAGRLAQAFEAGLDVLETAIHVANSPSPGTEGLPNTIIEEKGA
ncbi:MAG TPA: TPM domain-containing protein [Smithellaceae bacterium]|nr:TPM domain-containing protein [Smithellaceae bacterium]